MRKKRRIELEIPCPQCNIINTTMNCECGFEIDLPGKEVELEWQRHSTLHQCPLKLQLLLIDDVLVCKCTCGYFEVMLVNAL